MQDPNYREPIQLSSIHKFVSRQRLRAALRIKLLLLFKKNQRFNTVTSRQFSLHYEGRVILYGVTVGARILLFSPVAFVDITRA